MKFDLAAPINAKNFAEFVEREFNNADSEYVTE